MDELKKQKAYIFLYSKGKEGQDPLAIIYAYDFPQVGEDISIWDNEFRFYTVVKRLYGINKPNESAVWNIYVIKKED